MTAIELGTGRLDRERERARERERGGGREIGTKRDAEREIQRERGGRREIGTSGQGRDRVSDPRTFNLQNRHESRSGTRAVAVKRV